jgi:DNA cross-link repair 1B protein
MGTIFFTGDFRFSQNMILNNDILFPDKKAAIHIDEMIFDNTYCDPMF